MHSFCPAQSSYDIEGILGTIHSTMLTQYPTEMMHATLQEGWCVNKPDKSNYAAELMAENTRILKDSFLKLIFNWN